MRWLRTLFERMARSRVIWRQLGNGAMVAVSPDSQLKYLKSHFDEDLLALAKAQVAPGASVWDIGANCGSFIFACDQAGHRLAVEADPFLCRLLQDSVRRNGLATTIVHAAISDGCGEASFCIARRGRAANHLASVAGSTQAGGTRATIRVSTRTLDDLLDQYEAPDFVKIDVEGAEVLALRGATRLLAQGPTLYLEVTRETQDQCRSILEASGYAIEECAPSANWLAAPIARPERIGGRQG